MNGARNYAAFCYKYGICCISLMFRNLLLLTSQVCIYLVAVMPSLAISINVIPLTVAFNHGDMDDLMSARMILSGIRPEDEAYLQHQLTTMTKEEREGFKQGRLPVDQCYYLMGTTDPTGTLKPHEVCVIL